jgi:hypothetical protein
MPFRSRSLTEDLPGARRALTGSGARPPIGGTAALGSPLASDDSGRDVMFVDSAGHAANDRGTPTAWKGPAPIGGTARADSGIAEGGGGADAVFINPAGAVVNDWAPPTAGRHPPPSAVPPDDAPLSR